jgi:multiple sugar transport system permease protein
MLVKKIVKSGVLYVLPALFVIAVVMFYPLIYTLVMGFFRNTLSMPKPVFAGFTQYVKLFKDSFFMAAIGHTLAWTIGSVTFQFLLGFFVAMLLHQPFVRYKAVFRILLMVPWVLPSIIGSAVWKWMYNADYGFINFFFSSLHLIKENHTWLSNPDTAMAMVVIVNVWKMFPFVLLMTEAALQGVPKQIKEAAIIDGAGRLGVFRNVTWPSIAPACYSVILLLIIWTLNAFTFIYNLTMGGPARSTEVLAMYIYNRAFVDYDFGIASGSSAILFIMSILISVFYMRMTKKSEEIGVQ